VSARHHPRLVGAFVLGAVLLVLVAILALSSADWFKERSLFTVFFPGSVKGLNSGAPVTFRGVKVGEVKEVSAILTGAQQPAIQIEVVVEVVGDVVKVPEGMSRPFAGLPPEAFAKALIERGIRARMQSASLLTGQRYIDLDFLPAEPARFAGLHPRYPELPTTPTAIEKLSEKASDFMDKLAELPLDEMLEDVRSAIRSARELLGSPEVKGAFASADRAFKNVEPLLKDARSAIADADALLKDLKTELDLTGPAARESLDKLRGTLARAERSMESLDSTLKAADDGRLDAARTLDELAQTLATLRNLVEYLQTHPEAVVLGKPSGKERK
jgi:paraquat-inducible protein B